MALSAAHSGVADDLAMSRGRQLSGQERPVSPTVATAKAAELTNEEAQQLSSNHESDRNQNVPISNFLCGSAHDLLFSLV